MDFTGTYDIPASRDTVWSAINDPEVLQACIPGCQSLTPTDEGEGGGYEATVKVKVGPLNATFKGHVRIDDVVAPESYTITGEGKGGAAGFAKGGAKVALEEIEAGTRLTYTADAQVGGKMAQMGSRLIQGAAKKYADDFFACLVERLSAAPAEDEATATTPDAMENTLQPGGDAPAAPPPASAGANRAVLWGFAGGAALIILLIILAFG